MKIVKNKDFERDDSVKRHDNPDSPLRFPMHAQLAETHEERIHWLYYENEVILKEYLSAKVISVAEGFNGLSLILFMVSSPPQITLISTLFDINFVRFVSKSLYLIILIINFIDLYFLFFRMLFIILHSIFI